MKHSSLPSSLGVARRTALAAIALALSGCGTESLRAVTREDRPARQTCEPLAAAVVDRAWESAPLAVLTSELSPAVLVHTTRPVLGLFQDLAAWGLDAPLHVAFATDRGIQVQSRVAHSSLAIAGDALREPWLLVWWSGARGFSAWDSPWLVVWQHRPLRATLDDTGLSAEGQNALGYVALMPLFGLHKPDTSGWTELPSTVLARARTWTRALRQYPLAVRERFRIDERDASVVIHDQFSWLQIKDDWGTEPLKLAPLSPTLGLAHQSQRMPQSLSAAVTDLGVVTPFGPYLAIENADCHETRLGVLDYIERSEAAPAADFDDPIVATANARLQAEAERVFGSSDGFFHQDFGDPPGFTSPPPQPSAASPDDNTTWATLSAQYYCRVLPLLDPALQNTARARLYRWLDAWVLQEGRFQAHEGKLLLPGPGVGSEGAYGAAGKHAAAALITLWACARELDAFALIQNRWPLIEKLFVTPREMSWRSFGRSGILELGDEAAPALAMARLAHFAGAEKTARYAAYVFARELVHHVVKYTGARYFADHQPLYDTEPLTEPLFLTHVWGDVAGWRFDGPTYPANASDRWYEYRWVRFGDLDVARFHREQLLDLSEAELAAPFTTALWKGDTAHDLPHLLPSLVRLRSLLLDEPPSALARWGAPDAFQEPASASIAYALSFLRTSRPPVLSKLFSLARADDWEEGIEREPTAYEPMLIVGLASQAQRFPVLYWWGWSPPLEPVDIPASTRWSFGAITTDVPIGTVRRQKASRNTEFVAIE